MDFLFPEYRYGKEWEIDVKRAAFFEGASCARLHERRQARADFANSKMRNEV
jgi:hypothetical protein